MVGQIVSSQKATVENLTINHFLTLNPGVYNLQDSKMADGFIKGKLLVVN